MRCDEADQMVAQMRWDEVMKTIHPESTHKPHLIENSPICRHCEVREATTTIGPIADWRYQTPCCEQCVIEIQLEHARERAAAIPELEKRLAEIREDNSND